jgi:hypothetical protein
MNKTQNLTLSRIPVGVFAENPNDGHLGPRLSEELNLLAEQCERVVLEASRIATIDVYGVRR